MRIWIDTDIGSDVDDALALAYALRHPDLQVVGVSTVFGDIPVRSAIARRLLDLAGAGDVPVLPGLGVPLTDGKVGVMFGHEGHGLLDGPEPVVRTASEDGGGARIAELVAAIDAVAPDVLVAIGPLTNLAAMVRAGATLPPLAVMGGKLTEVAIAHMTADTPEWNWFCDPVAAQVVLGAGHATPPVLLPAEMTFRTRLADGDVDALADGDELAAAVAVLCRHWLEHQRTGFGSTDPAVTLHDPLTVAVLVAESLCTFAPHTIRVDERGACHHGGEGAGPVRAAVDVDADAVRRHLMDHLLGPRA